MKKLTISIILMFVITIVTAQIDTVKVDYINILNIDTTDYDPEGFFVKLEEHYSPLGDIIEMSCILGDNYYNIEKICIRFKHCPQRWFCYTPEEAEEKLVITFNKK